MVGETELIPVSTDLFEDIQSKISLDNQSRNTQIQLYSIHSTLIGMPRFK
jgi:hypothetical protein